jgi:hypothetical protein
MLRGIVFVFGMLLLAAVFIQVLYGGAFVTPVAVVGAVLVLGVVLERVVYKRVDTGRLGPEWQRTEERFIDPDTGKAITVFVKSKSGERRYVEEGDGPG